MPEIGAMSTVQRYRRWRRSRSEGGGLGRRRPNNRRLRYSPPLGTKAREADAASRGRLSAWALAERGARDEPSSERSAAPDGAGGRAGLPQRSARSLADITAEVAVTAARPRGVNCRACPSCDSCLLESRSPPRDASADRSWRWPECCPRRRSRPNPGRRDSSR